MGFQVKVKICCIASPQEARLAIDFGADALGLVGEMPSGPGVISDVRIREIAEWVAPPVATFLLSSQVTARGICDHYGRVHTSAIQLVDQPDPDAYSVIRETFPHLKLVQVIHVLDEKSVEEAITAAPQVDVLLLDSGNPNLQVKELGGTGRVHNWALSRLIRESVDIPVFLAGGLHAGNVRAAIDAVQPFGVDLCSGVRTGGQLDPHKLEAFFSSLDKG
ncbi:MAG: phosphoribosylanthranilate isomerase [Saprospiraceae bacterium]|jgi:phosphoribosylanthranilate isomerase|nr:phosphoribosylanthranilate isomerase [Saprospiraceae bacterium]